MKRGELWTAAANPDYAGKPRPVLIIQVDRHDDLDSITVVGLTSDSTDASFRPTILPEPGNGLQGKSRVMIDKVMTIPRRKMGYRIGRLSDGDMAAVNRALLSFLGLA